jgi:peptidyl-dipeptidase A
MWGQSWLNIYDIVVPYPNEKQINITEKLLTKNYTPLKMFHVSTDFIYFSTCGLRQTFLILNCGRRAVFT